MNEFRTVIDTGVVVSAALIPGSIPRQAFDAAMNRGKVLVSEPTVEELDMVLRRPKFNKYLSEEKRQEFLAALVKEAEIVEITENVVVCRDPDDDKFLELAVSGRASHIMSSDGDLVGLAAFACGARISNRYALHERVASERG